MAAPTIRAIMLGIEARLDTIDGLNTFEYAPDLVTVPAAVVGPPPIPNYLKTFAHGHLDIQPTVRVVTSTALDRAGQLLLADYANPTGALSIRTAIEGDKTLGGIVDDCIVVDFDPIGLMEINGVAYYGGIFTLRVIAQGA